MVISGKGDGRGSEIFRGQQRQAALAGGGGLGLALPASVRDSLDEALLAADQLMPQAAHQLTELARTAFGQGFSAVIASATLLLVCTALWTGWRLRGPRR